MLERLQTGFSAEVMGRLFASFATKEIDCTAALVCISSMLPVESLEGIRKVRQRRGGGDDACGPVHTDHCLVCAVQATWKRLMALTEPKPALVSALTHCLAQWGCHEELWNAIIASIDHISSGNSWPGTAKAAAVLHPGVAVLCGEHLVCTNSGGSLNWLASEGSKVPSAPAKTKAKHKKGKHGKASESVMTRLWAALWSSTSALVLSAEEVHGIVVWVLLFMLQRAGCLLTNATMVMMYT